MFCSVLEKMLVQFLIAYPHDNVVLKQLRKLVTWLGRECLETLLVYRIDESIDLCWFHCRKNMYVLNQNWALLLLRVSNRKSSSITGMTIMLQRSIIILLLVVAYKHHRL